MPSGGECVIDASALVIALVGKGEGAATLRQQLPGRRQHAPHLVDAELGNVLRRHVHAGRISSEEAETGLRSGWSLVDHRYPHAGPLAERAWALRDNLSFYDALYVALAAQLGIPLLTGDTRVSRAPGLPCQVELC